MGEKHERHKGAIVVTAIILAVTFSVILFQQIFKTDSLLPFGIVNGKFTKINSEGTITQTYGELENKTFKIKAGSEEYVYTVGDLGVSLNQQATLENYKVKNRLTRLIPFSIFAQILHNYPPIYNYNKDKLSITVAAIIDGLNVDPLSASISADSSGVKVISSQNGVRYNASRAIEDIIQSISNHKYSLKLEPELIEPDVTTAEMKTAVDAYVKQIPDDFQLKYGDKTVPLDENTIRSWIISYKENGQPKFNLSTVLVQSYADSVQGSFTSESLPTPTIISFKDGVETGRLYGFDGYRIDGAQLTNDIETALMTKTHYATVSIKYAPSEVKYAYSFSHSQAGLQLLLDQITAGKEISIKYIDLSDRGWIAASREHTRSRMASTYKMFVLYSVLKRIDEGSMHFTDEVLGTNVDACLQTIIIDSNNECAIALSDRIGWIKIQDEGKALGATELDWREELYGTVSDAAVIPLKLAKGEILSESSRNYMLDLMKRQRFRDGIPAGTESVVADKVGFIDGWLNDAAIVYSPAKPYILAIYTYDESWANIAEITRQIENVVL
ncbi:serine hydrolase [Candidatus Saccharibacteria bacterium]|nr:serine hydrolase [Candidatus Saccharibacteria bacterium]